MRYIFNCATKEWFRRVHPKVQSALLQAQDTIEKLVLSAFPGGVATSGIRSSTYNRSLPGSKPDSLHLHGCARDYRLVDGFPTVIPGLKVVREKDHYHVELVP